MKILIFPLLFLTLISCAKEGTKSVSLDFNQFVTNSNEYHGGIYLYGVSEKGNSFTRILNPGSSTYESEIPNDIWRFYILAWESNAGANAFAGPAKCGASEKVDLNSNDQEVTIYLENSVCYEFDDSYTDPHFYLGTFDLKVNDSGTCNLVTGNNCQPYSIGLVTHGKIVVPEINVFNGELKVLDKSRSSNCFELISALDPTFINFPFKNIPGHFGIGILELHHEATCNSPTTNQVQKIRIGSPRIYKESSTVKVLVD